MRWGLLTLVLLVGCGDDGTTTPDAGPDASTDGGTDTGPMDAGTDSGPDLDAGMDDAGADDAGADDAGADDAGGGVVCGWSEADFGFTCGGTDPMPDTLVCTGDECCTPTPCSPDDDQVCCDMVTGEIRTVFYAGGSCEELTESCDE